jgi:hypothetical protein
MPKPGTKEKGLRVMREKALAAKAREPRTLKVIAAEINAEHAAAERALTDSLQHARRCGELLIEAKKSCMHGDWQGWVERNVAGSYRTAAAYMRIAREWGALSKSAEPAHLSIDAALKMLAAPKSEPVTIEAEVVFEEDEEDGVAPDGSGQASGTPPQAESGSTAAGASMRPGARDPSGTPPAQPTPESAPVPDSSTDEVTLAESEPETFGAGSDTRPAQREEPRHVGAAVREVEPVAEASSPEPVATAVFEVAPQSNGDPREARGVRMHPYLWAFADREAEAAGVTRSALMERWVFERYTAANGSR